MPLPKVLAPLRRGPFARYMAGEFVSMTGTWMQGYAQSWLVTGMTTNALVLGGLNFTAGIPLLLLSLVGGRLADRYNKRNIILGALAIQFGTAVVIGGLVRTHALQIWHIFVAAGLVGIASAFEMPAVAAFVPELVPRDEMSRAITIDRSSFHATRLIGPSVGGILIKSFGEWAAYLLNAGSFLALGAALLSIKVTRKKVAAGQSAEASEAVVDAGKISEGLAYVRRDPPTRAMLGLMAAMTCFVSPFVILTMPYYGRYALGVDVDSLGTLLAVSGAGSLIGSLTLLGIRDHQRHLALKIAAFGIVAALCGLAAAHSPTTAFAPVVLLTVGVAVTFGTGNIVIQERAPNFLRGRISSVASLAFFGIVPFSGVAITGLIDRLGIRSTMLLGATGYGLLATYLLVIESFPLTGHPAESQDPAGHLPATPEEVPSSTL